MNDQLSLEGVGVTLQGRRILDEVSATIPAGAVTALVGPNGSGKSTLLRAIAGGHPIDGLISLGDMDLASLPARARARTIAQLPQESDSELPLLGADIVRLGRIPHEGLFGGDDGASGALQRALAISGAGPFMDRRFSRLSGGERQRVRLAAALAQEPRVLLLDEPTNHLDLAAQDALVRVLADLAGSGTTVIAALHDLNHAALADHVVVLAAGLVRASGDPRSALTPEVIDEVFGMRGAWFTHPLTGRPAIAVASRLPDDV